MEPFHLFILVSATWRLSSLFANEKGPFHVFLSIRNWAERACTKDGLLQRLHFHDGLCCEWCNSIWFGTLVTVVYFYFGSGALWVLLPFAISTWVVFIKYVRERVEGV